MSGKLRFDERVVLVTGAGNGLGRAHALLFASRGARVVVNDLGGGADGEGRSSAAADRVVEEIRAAGGEAVADTHSVEDGAAVVQTALDTWGRIDVVVNNAGILRDRSFAKMTDEDWDLVLRVHLLGAFRVTHAAWPHLRAQQYGRVIVTSSAAGIYGNFGQANYGAAKLGLVGLANTLALEGAKRNIHVNAIAPIAGSRLTEGILPPELHDALDPACVSPLVAWLCHEHCAANGGLFEVGGGFFAALRQERAAGETIRLGRDLSPELVRDRFDGITAMDATTHPATIMASMEPVMANVRAGPSRGGNRFIDADLAHGYTFPESTTSYDARDLALYALGVGAGRDPLDVAGLQLVYENHGAGFRSLPTYAVVPAVNVIISAAMKGQLAPGFHFGLDRLLHGEQYTEVKRPLPRQAVLTHRTRVKDVVDKGKNALIVLEQQSFDDDGDLLIVNEFTAVIRGAGGWGGDRGTNVVVEVPDREPDAVVTDAVPDGQALLYRLSGDWNPLHVDPNMARAFGFERPILHGLCTYGFVARHVIDAFCGGDPRTFRSIRVRFADSVFPGETLRTDMWRVSDTEIVLLCTVVERDAVVIKNARVTLYTEIPTRTVGAPTPEAAAPPPDKAPSAAVFEAIGAYVAAHPDLVASVGTIYRFVLTDPDSTWTVDLQNGAGAVARGDAPAPGCTLTLTEADFMALTAGEAAAQDLYFSGRLQIAGDLMASRKLTFLADLRKGDAAPAHAAPAPAEAPSRLPELRKALEALAPTIEAAVVQLRVGHTTWEIRQGALQDDTSAAPDCTLVLDEAALAELLAGTADARAHHQQGRLRIDGDIRAAQRIDWRAR